MVVVNLDGDNYFGRRITNYSAWIVGKTLNCGYIVRVRWYIKALEVLAEYNLSGRRSTGS